MIATVPTTQHTGDFDLHGLVGIRILSDRAEDGELVAGTLGPIQKPLTRPPDITDRFVERSDNAGPLSLMGGHDCVSGNEVFVTRGNTN